MLKRVLQALLVALRASLRWCGVALRWLETPLVRAFVRPGPLWSAVRVGLAALVLLLATLVAVGFLRLPASGEAAPLKLTLRPTYVAEQAQMRAEAPVFQTGLRAGGVRAWSKVPDTGVFGVSHADIRASLAHLLPGLGDLGDQWAANGAPSDAAAQMVSDLKKIDDRQKKHGGDAERVAIEYHIALAALYAGDRQDAAARFQDVLKLITAQLTPLEDAQSGGDAAAATGHDADLARLYAAQTAAEYGLGLAELADPGKRTDAIASLNAALATAEAHQDLVALPADKLSAKLFQFDPDRALMKLDVGDIYADLLAATIAAAGQGDAKATGDLAFLVKELQGKSLAGRPKLAANLEIAALLTGATNLVGAFTPDAAADDPAMTQVANEVRAVASSEQAVPDLHSYWGVVHAWRTDLENGDAGSIRQQLAGAPAQFQAERAWLGEALNDAYDDLKAPADRARFIQQYGDLLQGLSIMRSLEANMPLARYAGLPIWLATFLTVVGVAVAWLVLLHAVLVALRIREPWRVIYGSGYAADYRAHQRPEPPAAAAPAEAAPP